MEWKLFKRLFLTLLLFTLSTTAVSAVYNLSTLRKKKVQYLLEKNQIDKLKSYLEEGIKTPNLPTIIVQAYRKERTSLVEYQKILKGGALEIRSLLKNKYKEYYDLSKKDLGVVGYLNKYNEALYLHYLSKQLNDKSRDDETDSFTYLLLFISNRLEFKYDKAMEIHSALKDSKLKNRYSSILKKFVESEYPDVQQGTIPPQFEALFKKK